MDSRFISILYEVENIKSSEVIRLEELRKILMNNSKVIHRVTIVDNNEILLRSLYKKIYEEK